MIKGRECGKFFLMKGITIFTIGFASRRAEDFFTTLSENGVRWVCDVRLHNTSQLMGYTKKDDLAYFLWKIGGISYRHLTALAPSEELFARMKEKEMDWDTFAREFLILLSKRGVEKLLSPVQMNRACLLCRELLPDRCHRRLVAEYLKKKWVKVEIRHL